MSKEIKYVLYDDLRKVGEYTSIKKVCEDGLKKYHPGYIHKAFKPNKMFIKDNIGIFEVNDIFAHCEYLTHVLHRKARVAPRPFELKKKLEEILSDIFESDLRL